MRVVLQQDESQWPEVWKAVYRNLETEGDITPQQLRLWVSQLSLRGIEQSPEGARVSLGALNSFTAEWIVSNFLPQLEQSFSRVLGVPSTLEIAPFSESPGSPSPSDGASNPISEPSSAVDDPLSAQTTIPESGVLWGALSRGSATTGAPVFDPRYTFESFVVGASNQFAHASAYAVAENPARQYNPLFLYSQPGLGKTHLLHAIANGVLAKNPKARVLYISTERFVNELIESIKHQKMTEFRKKYRDSYDVLLFDDIQFIAGKERTEEEFFHTFNALHSSKRQIVLTSDRPPKEIQGLEERLRTRFEWGLIADITPPEIETRIAILKAKAERDDIYLPDDVATFLATYIKSNVRELEGVLIKLQAHASLTGAELSLDLAKQQLKLAIPEQGSTYTIESIQAAVAKHFRLKPTDFKSNSKQRSVARPRQIAMFLIRKYTSLGFKEIGQYFGGRDHTTILHACREIEKKLETDAEIKDAVESIQNLL